MCAGCVAPRPVSIHEQARARNLVDNGVEFLRTERLDEAQAAFAAAAQLDGSAAAIDGLGCVEFRRREFSEAEKLFLRAIEIDSAYAVAYGNLALLYDAAGNKEAAHRYFQEAIRRFPDDPQLRNNFAGHLRDQGANKRVVEGELQQARVLGGKHLAETNLGVLLGEER